MLLLVVFDLAVPRGEGIWEWSQPWVRDPYSALERDVIRKADPVVLVLGYTLFLAWLDEGSERTGTGSEAETSSA